MDYLDRLKIARMRKNFSQAALSRSLGFSHATYGLYEARKNKMDVETFGEICRLLGVTPNQMLGFEPWDENG